MSRGGADRNRTDDLLNANQALSRLSYSPLPVTEFEAGWTRGSGLYPAPRQFSCEIQVERRGTMEWNGCHLLPRAVLARAFRGSTHVLS